MVMMKNVRKHYNFDEITYRMLISNMEQEENAGMTESDYIRNLVKQDNNKTIGITMSCIRNIRRQLLGIPGNLNQAASRLGWQPSPFYANLQEINIMKYQLALVNIYLSGITPNHKKEIERQYRFSKNTVKIIAENALRLEDKKLSESRYIRELIRRQYSCYIGIDTQTVYYAEKTITNIAEMINNLTRRINAGDFTFDDIHSLKGYASSISDVKQLFVSLEESIRNDTGKNLFMRDECSFFLRRLDTLKKNPP